MQKAYAGTFSCHVSKVLNHLIRRDCRIRQIRERVDLESPSEITYSDLNENRK